MGQSEVFWSIREITILEWPVPMDSISTNKLQLDLVRCQADFPNQDAQLAGKSQNRS
jgi:hypothetical protein